MATRRTATAKKMTKKPAGKAARAEHPSPLPGDVAAILKAARFSETTTEVSRALGMRSFLGNKVGRWVLHATSFPERKGYAVDLVLNRRHAPGGNQYGTKHRFVTVDALAREQADAMEDLKRLAKDDDLLKCPKCNLRYVIQKQGTRGTFLSCEGMQRVYRRVDGIKMKDVACRGTSDRIPAVVIHR
jgi:hypothetical protein